MRFILVIVLAALGLAQTSGDTLVVADFDAGKAETRAGLALWLFCDEQFGGTSEAHATLIHPGAGNSPGALRLSFNVTGDFPTPLASAWAMVGPEGLATDVSAYRGVRFYARSSSGSSFAAGIVRFPGQIRRYTAAFTTNADWTLVDLPFGSFKQAPTPGANAEALDPKDVTSFGVGVALNLRGEFELDIDRIEFYR